MRLPTRVLVCGIAFGLLSGCHQGPSGPKPLTGASIRQEMATLAFLSYIGDDMKLEPTSTVEQKLVGCMGNALAEQAPGWSLAWGPAVYRFPIAELDDNMMYVARRGGNPQHPAMDIAIVIRGTDPPAILDWLVEDFDVVDQVPWPGAPSDFSDAKTSKGASEGLHILRDKLVSNGVSLTAFLQDEVTRYPTVRVYVTGHSLGGALAPTLALWLKQTRDQWDPQHKAELAVYPLAGPTAGNAEFASYYDRELGGQTDRLWNPYDIMPLAWNAETIEKMAGLYEPKIQPSDFERDAIDSLRRLVENKGYTQIDLRKDALPGAIQDTNTCQPGKAMNWEDELWWQHHWAYQCALNIRVNASKYKECPNKNTCAKVVCPRPS